MLHIFIQQTEAAAYEETMTSLKMFAEAGQNWSSIWVLKDVAIRESVLQTKKHENDSPQPLAWEWETATRCGAVWENSVMQIMSQKFIQKKKSIEFNFFL